MFQRYKNAHKQSYVCSPADVVLQVVQIRPISIRCSFLNPVSRSPSEKQENLDKYENKVIGNTTLAWLKSKQRFYLSLCLTFLLSALLPSTSTWNKHLPQWFEHERWKSYFGAAILDSVASLWQRSPSYLREGRVYTFLFLLKIFKKLQSC